MMPNFVFVQFQPSVYLGQEGSLGFFFFKMTVSALEKALEISLSSCSLSSWFGFVLCRIIPPLVIFLQFK